MEGDCYVAAVAASRQDTPGSAGSPAGESGRTRLSAVERRSQLVRIGRSVFAEKGYDATSVEEIAERAGISKPVVYEHFGGKEGLYAVIVDREMEFVIEQISAAISTGTVPTSTSERARATRRSRWRSSRISTRRQWR